jgi:hypothetical protein
MALKTIAVAYFRSFSEGSEENQENSEQLALRTFWLIWQRSIKFGEIWSRNLFMSPDINNWTVCPNSDGIPHLDLHYTVNIVIHVIVFADYATKRGGGTALTWQLRPQCLFCRSDPNIGPSLWSSGQSSWLQIQRSWVRFPVLPYFWEVVRLERGPLSLVKIIEELFQRKVAAPV